MPGYTRQDAANKISNGSVIDADVLDSEFDALVDVFSSDAGVGHNHNGQGEGARITVVGPAGDVTITSNEIVPNNTTVNLGTSGAPFADAWLSGTATIDTVVATTANIASGTIDDTVIGGTTAAAITGTTITANTGFTGNVTGDVTGTVSDISNHDTDALAEGATNLYYTDARAKDAIGVTANTGLEYNSTSGEFSGIDATTAVKGVARYNEDDFTVSSGVVALTDDITATTLVTTGDVTIEGNLYVEGTTTVVNTESVSIADNIITLNSDFTTGTPTADSGFEVLRGNESTVAFTWDESEDHFSTNGQPIKPSSLKIGNFELVDNGGSRLYIKYFGSIVASINGNGDFVASGDVVAYSNPA